MVVLHLLKRIIYLVVQRRRFVLSNYVNVGRQAKHKMGTILTNLRLTSCRRSKKVISTCTSYEFFLNLLMWVETIGLEVVRTKNFCNDTLNCRFSTLTNYIFFFLAKKKRRQFYFAQRMGQMKGIEALNVEFACPINITLRLTCCLIFLAFPFMS